MENPNAIVAHVNCPGNGDIFDKAAGHEAAFNLFRNQCPLGAYVAEVTAIRGKGRKKCAWCVRYVRNMAPEYQNIDSEQLALDLINVQPNNTQIIEKTKNDYPPSIEIVYSCRCRCNMSQHASMSIKRCVYVETIDKDFVNLKVEENLVNLKVEENLVNLKVEENLVNLKVEENLVNLKMEENLVNLNLEENLQE